MRKYVIRREIPAKEGKKPRSKAPKIQRLVTPATLQRKRRRMALKKRRIESAKEAAATYAAVLAQRAKERKEKRHELHEKRRLSSTRKSTGPQTSK